MKSLVFSFSGFLVAAVLTIPPAAAPDSLIFAQQTKQVVAASQKQAALDCFKSIRKLVSVVEVGLSFSQYTDRLIDTKAEIDQKLMLVGNWPFSFRTELGTRMISTTMEDEIMASIKAFLDAHELWRLALTERPAYLLHLDAKKIYAKYDIGVLEPPPNFDIAVSSRRTELLDRPLQTIWSASIKHLRAAEQGLSNTK